MVLRMEETVFIPSGDIRLEAVIEKADPARAGVVCHPHPMYGGSMDNNVVQAAVQSLSRSGWTSLRFNFRGVGQSGGTHGQGRGEGEDILSAVCFLKEGGAEQVLIVGYSFGAWVAAFAWKRLKNLGVLPLVLIAPPAAFMSFKDLSPDTEAGLIICGEHDSFAPPAQVQDLGQGLAHPAKQVIIAGTGHFFSGREPELTGILTDYIIRL